MVLGGGHNIERHILQQAEDILALIVSKAYLCISILNIFGITDTSTECKCSSPVFKLPKSI